MNYEDEKFIKVYTRDTAAWLALPWQCRGLMLEISRKIPQFTGELSLGRKGLATLAALLRADWSEIEPHVRELIADGRIVYDEEQQLIRDPQHVERQTAVSNGNRRSQDYREREKLAKAPSKPRKTKQKKTVTRCNADVTQSDAESLLDETRLDQTRPDETRDVRAREVPPDEPVESVVALAPPKLWSVGGPGLRALEWFEGAVSRATGTGFAVGRKPWDQEPMVAALNAHGPKTSLAGGELWLLSTVAEWVKSEGGSNNLGWEPKAFLRWLNGGRKAFASSRFAKPDAISPMSPYAPAKERGQPTEAERREAQRLVAAQGISFLDAPAANDAPPKTGTDE